MTTLEKVQEVVASQMRMDKSKVLRETDLKQEIKADSLDIAEMLFSIEDEFGIEIPTDRALEMKTVGEVVDLIDELIKSK